MPSYWRMRVAGGTYFFTATLLERGSWLLVEHIDALREAARQKLRERLFHIDGWGSCRITFIARLPCRSAILIFPTASRPSRSAWSVSSQPANFAMPPARKKASGASGRGASGNTSFATPPISLAIWMTFIAIRSSTGWLRMWRECTPPLGAARPKACRRRRHVDQAPEKISQVRLQAATADYGLLPLWSSLPDTEAGGSIAMIMAPEFGSACFRSPNEKGS